MYDVAMADNYGYVDEKDVENLIKPNTALIICTLSSNVCGSVQPFDKIAKLAKKYKIPFLLDASQGAGSIAIDMTKQGIDFLACPGHKGLLGPTGTGVLCINCDTELKTLMEGGTGSLSKLVTQPFSLTDRFESGTLNVAGIAGLDAALDYIARRTPKSILHHENRMCTYLADNIMSMKGLRLVGYNPQRKRTSVLSAVFDNTDSLIASAMLNIDYSIAVRAGFHCAYTAHTTLGTDKTGTVRFSPGPFTTKRDIDKLTDALYHIALQK
jgi:selenocysteine lyase/cysteine desulfurase